MFKKKYKYIKNNKKDSIEIRLKYKFFNPEGIRSWNGYGYDVGATETTTWSDDIELTPEQIEKIYQIVPELKRC